MSAGSTPRSIRDFFARPAPPPTLTKCPACNRSLPLRDINRHLDTPGECQPETQTTKEEDAKADAKADALFEDSDTEYEHLDDGGHSCSTPEKATTRQEGDYTFERCAAQYFSSPSPSPRKATRDDDEEEDDESEKNGPFNSSSQTATLSRHISADPNRFGGVQRLSSEWNVSASPSPGKRRRGNKVSPLPVKARTSSSTPSPAKRSLFSDGDQTDNGTTETKKGKWKFDPGHVPYYVVNFEQCVRSVVVETDDRRLFTEQELRLAESFLESRGEEVKSGAISLDAKKIYVRLFQRKLAWLKRSQIAYKEEVVDEDAALNELVDVKLLVDGRNLTDLETLLNLLPSPTLKALAKEMKVSSSMSQKPDLVAALLKLSKQKCVFFKHGNKENPTQVKIRKKAVALLGPCFRLEEESRKLFLRILSLFSLNNFWDERESDLRPQQLTTILLVNQGKLTFPHFEILRQQKIFRDRPDLLRFEEACGLEARMSQAHESKEWEEAVEVCQEAGKLFSETMEDEEFKEHVTALPAFLRRFTRGSVLAYVLSKGVDALERLKQHDQAVIMLETLLAQDLYLPGCHGHWRERLALDLDQHLKQPLKALEAVKAGLKDPYVREGRRLALCQRAQKICKTKKNVERFQGYLEVLNNSEGWLEVPDAPKEVVQGRLMPKDGLPGAKTVFMMEGREASQGDTLLCSVEEFVREHYRREGLAQGLHGEGAVINTLCAVLFWNVLYETVLPDRFRCPNQAVPLDFDTDDFYPSRKEEIDARLNEIRDSLTDEQLKEQIRSCWTRNAGVVSCANWDIFQGPDHLIGLLLCFTRRQIAGICSRLLRNHRHTRSGFPDLTLWDPDRRVLKIVEVKGPNDRLSTKQILWINYLISLGVDAVVCHVEASGAGRRSLGKAATSRSAKKRGHSKKSEDSGEESSPKTSRSARKRSPRKRKRLSKRNSNGAASAGSDEDYL